MMQDGIVAPGSHDGMAAFPSRHGRVRLIRNHEVGEGPVRLPSGNKVGLS
jgi:secreted PhoX family phosphatase